MISKKYNVILADPPWRYESGTTLKKWSIEEHYKTMSLDDLKAMLPQIDEIAVKDCVLYLWTTAPKLTEAIELLAAWKFLYRTCAMWHKSGMGMGHWFRIDHEILLLAVRGKPKTPEDTVLESSVFELKKTKHSEKPDYIRAYIERCFPDAKRIELFAREKFHKWDVWGNEAPEFNTVLFE
jgi:site-specific DNA-methyltransferase (adenine-specific)